ncbi:hypothetical protein DK66_2300 [Brucella suis 1330]|nr:hypothetical protein DK66_2300 [Brucella suis 1330]
MLQPQRFQPPRQIIRSYAFQKKRLHQIKPDQKPGIKRRPAAKYFPDISKPAFFGQRETGRASPAFHMAAHGLPPALLRHRTGLQEKHPIRADSIERDIPFRKPMESATGTFGDKRRAVTRAMVDHRHAPQQPFHHSRHQP